VRRRAEALAWTGPLAWAGALALLVAGCRTSGSERPLAAPPDTPFVLISIDTLRADHLPAYGYRGVETPNLDALRRDSILFQNAFSQAPLTLPSHLSLLSGLLPPEHGVRDNLGYRFDASAHPTIPGLLRSRGYASGAFVSAYVLRGDTGLGAAFDRYDDVSAGPVEGQAVALVRRSGGETVQHALEWLRSLGGRPFFLFVHLYEPHFPYEPREPFKSRYPRAYDGTIAEADAVVGELVDALKRDGLYQKALLALVSDHGEGLGDHGEQTHGILLYREALRVPLLLKLPAARQATTEVASPVALVDLMPTAAEILGFAAPKSLKGRSLLAAGRRPYRVYSETYYPRVHLGWSELRSLVDERYHFIDGPKPELYELADARETQSLLSQRSAAADGLKRELDAQGSSLAAPTAVDPQVAERLRALGYLGGEAAPAEGSARENPRDHIQEYEAIQAAFRLTRLGRDEEAVRAFEGLLRKNPQLFDVAWELGTTLARLGRNEAAATAIDGAMKTSPSMAPLAAVSLAQVELRLGRLESAAAHARLALESDPVHAHELLARVALARSDLTLATHEASLARTGDGHGSTLLAEVRIRQGAFAQALAELDEMKARAAGRAVPSLEFLRGDALARLKRNADAEVAFKQEIHDFPRNTQAYASLAILYATQGHAREEVLGVLESMLRANRSRDAALLGAKTLEFLGADADAERWRRRTLSGSRSAS